MHAAIGEIAHLLHHVAVAGSTMRWRRFVASCSFAGLVSTAMTRPAPATSAPLIAAMPTPPQPITTTVSPG
jgi:hypothetical protein